MHKEKGVLGSGAKVVKHLIRPQALQREGSDPQPVRMKLWWKHTLPCAPPELIRLEIDDSDLSQPGGPWQLYGVHRPQVVASVFTHPNSARVARRERQVVRL